MFLSVKMLVCSEPVSSSYGKLLLRKAVLDIFTPYVIITFAIKNLRSWRNWQTRTFEGRMVLPYGFKSHRPHHLFTRPYGLFFVLGMLLSI